MSRLYLKNLPSHSQKDIVKYLERFGKLTEFKIVESGAGFAQYDSAQDAKFVLDTFRDQLFLGHRTVIELARPLRKDMPSTESHSTPNPSWRMARSPRYTVQPKYYSNRAHQCRYPVFVENIPRHICWQELKDFGRLAGGAVAYCDLDRSRDGRGFIEYLSREDSEDAIKWLDGQKLGGCAVRVSAHSRATRRRSRSRSRSPIRRPCRVPDTAPKTSDEPPHSCVFPTSASRYSLREIPSDRFTFPLYPDNPAPPVVLPDLYALSRAVESYQQTVARGTVQTYTSTDLTEPVKRELGAAAPLVAHDYYDFDAYLRLSYDRRLNGIYS